MLDLRWIIPISSLFVPFSVVFVNVNWLNFEPEHWGSALEITRFDFTIYISFSFRLPVSSFSIMNLPCLGVVLPSRLLFLQNLFNVIPKLCHEVFFSEKSCKKRKAVKIFHKAINLISSIYLPTKFPLISFNGLSNSCGNDAAYWWGSGPV